jgi:hypothetical protein
MLAQGFSKAIMADGSHALLESERQSAKLIGERLVGNRAQVT